MSLRKNNQINEDRNIVSSSFNKTQLTLKPYYTAIKIIKEFTMIKSNNNLFFNSSVNLEASNCHLVVVI